MISKILRIQKQFQFFRLQLRNEVRFVCLCFVFSYNRHQFLQPNKKFKMIISTGSIRGVFPLLSCIVCNSGSDSDLQFMYYSSSHLLNSR